MMAAADNPYFIQPASPLQALLAGQQGYDRAQKGVKEQQTEAGRKEAMEALQSGGDLRSPLAKLIGIGDMQGAKVIADYAEHLTKKKAEEDGVFGTPIYGTDQKGGTVLGAIGKRGDWKQINTPGVNITPGIKTIDTGTGTLIVGARSGQPIAGQPGQAPQGGGAPVPTGPVIPKDIEGREAAEKRGQAQGSAEVTLPSVLSKSQQAIKLIDDMVAHPGRETTTGMSGKLDPRNYIPGTDATDFRVRQKQLQGKTFLEAFESLKGGGAITEVEGLKATEAIARLDLSQSDDEYKKALLELRGILHNGMRLAVAKAKGGKVDTSADVRLGPALDKSKNQSRVGKPDAVDWQTYFGGAQ